MFLIMTVGLVATVSFIIIFFYGFNNSNANEESIDEKVILKNPAILFADNYVSYVLQNDDPMSFNIFAVEDVSKGDASLSDLINGVTVNNANIETLDFSVEEGITTNHYQLVNMIVEFKVLTDDIEKAEQIKISLKNGEVRSYDIGEIILQNDKLFQKDDLVPKGDYNVGYPSPSLDVHIANNADSLITVHSIEDINQNFFHDFKDENPIEVNQKKNLVIPSIEFENEFDFYTLTPLLTYSIKGQEYTYNMPGVIYGITLPDEEKIKRIVSN